MRLRRLDLTRYGAFTDQSLDFGAAKEDVPDLHIVYGANEAGKSTLRNAINDLLFRIEPQSDYDFLHGYRAMEIGAALDIGERTVEWRRLKRNKDDLLDADGNPANSALLDAALGGMDRQTFELMFSLDGEKLKEGGEELHRSRGRLGEILFAATSGLSSISEALDGVRGEADAFFKPRGKKQRLNELKHDLEKLDARLKEVEVSAPEYRKLQEALREARDAHQEARGDADAIRKRLRQVERWQTAMRDGTKLRTARERLAPLCNTPEIPDEAAERVHELDERASGLRRDLEQKNSDLERLTAERDKQTPDETLLAEAGRIERLTRLESGFQDARDSRPGAEAELAAERGRLMGTLEKLGVQPDADPRDLLVPAPVASELHELIRVHDRVSADLIAAKEEAENALVARDEIAQSLKAIGERIEPAVLHQLRRDMRAAHSTSDAAELEQSAADVKARCDAAYTALHPWTGTAESLRALTIPEPDALRRWADELATLKDARDQAERKRAEQDERAAEFRSAAEALREASGLLGDDDLNRAREARNASWRAHRQAISDGALSAIRETADTFESAMNADDKARDDRERHRDDAARLRQLKADAVQAEATAKRAEQNRDAHQEAIDALQAQIDAASAECGLPAGWEPERIGRWIDTRERALTEQAEHDAATAKLERQLEQRDNLHERLMANLTTAGTAPTSDMALEALCEMAETVLQHAESREAKRTQKREELAKAKAQLEARERRMAEAREAREDWTARWDALIASCWLGAQGRQRTPAEVREILGLLDELGRSLERCEALERNIARWQSAEDEFVELCRAVCTATGASLDETDPARTATTLREGLKAAQDSKSKREQTETQIERVGESLAKTQRDLESVDAELQAMCARFGAADVETLRGTIKNAREKTSIASEIADLEAGLRESFDGRPLSEIEHELSACDRDSLATEADQLTEQLNESQERVQHLYHEMKTAEKQVEAVGADEKAAELAEERRVLLLQLEEETQRYLRLVAGVSAAEAALRLYRDRHRSEMMLNAGKAFRHITGGRFTDLQSRPDKDGETLIAIKAGGGSLVVGEMSDGTRDQLYLALRLAGYREFAGTREPLPFIADDVMQSFDEDRTCASFEMLVDAARLGQVVYLTHHAHVCELARQAVGDAVTIHELPGPGAGASALVTAESTG